LEEKKIKPTFVVIFELVTACPVNHAILIPLLICKPSGAENELKHMHIIRFIYRGQALN